MTYDARGNGDGHTVCTITGDHNGHISDFTALVVEDSVYTVNADITPKVGGQKATALRATQQQFVSYELIKDK